MRALFPVFPLADKLRKQTGRDDVSFRGFELYTLRHTCLTRWAPHMEPWTLAYLAGHRDMNITTRYVHPQEQTIRGDGSRSRRRGWAYRVKSESGENGFGIATA